LEHYVFCIVYKNLTNGIIFLLFKRGNFLEVTNLYLKNLKEISFCDELLRKVWSLNYRYYLIF